MSRLLVFVFMTLISLSSAAEQEVIKTWGKWSKICTGTDEMNCQIVQSANQNDTGKLVFQTSVGYVEDNDKPIMFMTAPLGIYLPKGISFFVDEEHGKQAAVQRCDGTGCLAVLALTEDFLGLLLKTKKASDSNVVFATRVTQNVRLPVSMEGFKQAFKSLKKKKKATSE